MTVSIYYSYPKQNSVRAITAKAGALISSTQLSKWKNTLEDPMDTDAVGESTEAAKHAPATAPPIEAARSGDCSAVNLESPEAEQDGATSTPAQQASQERDAVTTSTQQQSLQPDAVMTEQDGAMSMPAQQTSFQHHAVATEQDGAASIPAQQNSPQHDTDAKHCSLKSPAADQDIATLAPPTTAQQSSPKRDAVAKDYSLKSPAADQHGATSTPAQHDAVTAEQDGAMPIVAWQNLPQHAATVKDFSLRSPARRSLRKRKQPERSDAVPVEANRAAPLQNASAPLDNASASVQNASTPLDSASAPLQIRSAPASKAASKAEDAAAGRAAKSARKGKAEGKGKKTATGRKQNPKSKYDAVIGRTVDISAPIFSVDIPDLYYRGTVTKKDPAHPGSVIVRFEEDGSRYWFPVTEVERFLGDMDNKGRDTGSETIGQGSDAFAAEVLAGTLVAKKKASGMSSSSATAGQHEGEVSSGVQSKKAAGRSPSRLSRQTGGAAPEQETSSLQALAAAADSGGV